jgi:hypothetical protein
MAISIRRGAGGVVLLAASLLAGMIACGFDGKGSGSGGAAAPGTDGSSLPGTGGEGGSLPGADGAPGTDGGGNGDGGDAANPSNACTRDGGGAGILCGSECVDPTRDHEHCGSCSNGCNVTSACEGTCVAVASALDGLRYEYPCLDSASPYCNGGSAPAAKIVTLTGTAGKSYVMTVRFRGVLEQKTYNGEMSANAQGTNAAFFVAGGSPANDLWNAYLLQVTSPPRTFYLNGGASGHSYVDPIDYTAKITVAAGATLTLDSSSSDGSIVRNRDQANGDAIVIPVIKPAPQAFNGQFVQIDVVTVSLTP